MIVDFSSITPPDLICEESLVIKYSNLLGSDEIKELHPQEVELILGLPQKRQNEFLTGRLCIRKALRKLHMYDCPVLYDEYKMPAFPAGVVGSVSHTAKHCIVLIGLNKKYLSIGVDVEDIKKMKQDYFDTICTKEELVFLKKYTDKEQLEKATVFFTAKEAFYKLQFQITHEMLCFKDINCSILDNSTFSIVLRKKLSKRFVCDAIFYGKYSVFDNMVYSFLFLENK